MYAEMFEEESPVPSRKWIYQKQNSLWKRSSDDQFEEDENYTKI